MAASASKASKVGPTPAAFLKGVYFTMLGQPSSNEVKGSTSLLVLVGILTGMSRTFGQRVSIEFTS